MGETNWWLTNGPFFVAGALLLFLFSFYLIENSSNGNIAAFFKQGSLSEELPSALSSLPFPAMSIPSAIESPVNILPGNENSFDEDPPDNSSGPGSGGNSGNDSSENNGCGEEGCPPSPFCGDGQRNGDESCDGSDFGSFGNGDKQCALFDPVFVSGNLLCDDCEVDTALCQRENNPDAIVPSDPSTGNGLLACSNGVDDDGDGLVDWQYDLGCSDSADESEEAESLSNENGWSTFDPSANTSIIYVSSSQGNDSWDGKCPDTPTSGLCGPKKNIFAGVNVLRNGFPDWLLLRRGDTWNAAQEFTSNWSLSGESASKPIVIASYGSSTQRPHIITDTGFIISSSGLVSNVAMLDLHFTRANNDVADTQGIFLLGGARSFLIENVLVERYNLNIGTQAWNNLSSQDVSIRRSIIADAFSKSTDHVQGGYFSGVDTLLLEDTLWVHNGWSETISGATPANIFRRNIYVQADATNVTVRGIISAQSSSEGIQLRPGGIIEDSLFLKNSGNFFGCTPDDYDNCGWGNPSRSGDVRRNVFLESRNISPNDPRGSGLRIEAVNTRVYDNIFSHGGSDPATYNVMAIELAHSSSNVDVYNNIVYDWSRPGQLGSAAISIASDIVAHISNNTFQMPMQGDVVSLQFSTPPTQLSFLNNRYFSASSTPFEYEDAHHDFSAWVSHSGETGSSLTQVAFPHPERDISTYMSSLGGTPSLDGFLTQARAQSRWNWRDEYSAQAVNEYIREGFTSA